jgi:hypothetical protein
MLFFSIKKYIIYTYYMFRYIEDLIIGEPSLFTAYNKVITIFYDNFEL